MLSSYERHLKRHRYGYSINKDHEFSRTREVLKCKQKNLKTQCKGNIPKRADPIDDNNDIALLYEKGCLDTSTPISLLNTMWFLNTLRSGIRGGGEEHRLLCWGDITLNVEYLEYNERQTRTGEDVRNVRDSKPRMYAVPDISTCSVKMYKAYKARGPSDFCSSDKPFYLATVTQTTNPREDEQWFLCGL